MSGPYHAAQSFLLDETSERRLMRHDGNIPLPVPRQARLVQLMQSRFTHAFDQWRDAISRAFGDVAQDAFARLSDDDRPFIARVDKIDVMAAEITLTLVPYRGPGLPFRPVAVTYYAVAPGAWHREKSLVTLLRLQAGHEHRFYVFDPGREHGLRFEEIARADDAVADALAHREWDMFETEAVRDAKRGGDAARHRTIPIGEVDTRGVTLGDTVAGTVRAKLETRPASAYQKTDAELHRETVDSVLLGLIPFYTCADESRKGNTPEAVISCAFDIIGLVPVAGVLVKGGTQFARVTAVTAMKAAMFRHLPLSRMRLALGPLGVNYAAEARALSKAVAPALATSLVQSVDPGIELTQRMATLATRSAITAIDFIRQRAPLARLATQLKSLPDHVRQVYALEHSEPSTRATLDAMTPDAHGLLRIEDRTYVSIDNDYFPVSFDQRFDVWRMNAPTLHLPRPYPIPLVFSPERGRWIMTSVGLSGGAPNLKQRVQTAVTRIRRSRDAATFEAGYRHEVSVEALPPLLVAETVDVLCTRILGERHTVFERGQILRRLEEIELQEEVSRTEGLVLHLSGASVRWLASRGVFPFSTYPRPGFGARPDRTGSRCDAAHERTAPPPIGCLVCAYRGYRSCRAGGTPLQPPVFVAMTLRGGAGPRAVHLDSGP